jgi:hypothetical protein
MRTPLSGVFILQCPWPRLFLERGFCLPGRGCIGQDLVDAFLLRNVKVKAQIEELAAVKVKAQIKKPLCE